MLVFRSALRGTIVGLALFGGRPVAGQAVECATTSTTTSDAACSGCPCKGDCDVVGVRNQWSPESLGAMVNMAVRVKIHYFFSGLTNLVVQQRTKIIEDFEDYHIALQVTPSLEIDSQYNEIDSPLELAAMRSQYGESPTTTLNVFVAYYNRDYFDYDGRAVFPWDNDALTSQGGILVQATAIGEDNTTLTHEIGHALGLWHTSHGTALGEMDGIHGTCTSGVCSCQCYEPADGSNCNARGDFCCDTPPTPGNFSCQNPGGEDGCSETNWGETDYQNFMGFAADGGGTPCRSQFTVQQSRRMHCWACDRLKG